MKIMNYFEKVKALATITDTTPTVKALCFDMDGTIADLYGVEGWLEKLRAYDASPYIQAEPMCDMELLAELLHTAMNRGIEVRIITWLSKESTKEYDELVRMAKRVWLDYYNIPYDHFHGVAYGTTKANMVRATLNGDECETAVLFDDNAKVRSGWHMGESYDPATCDICEVIKGILGIEV
jgi:hypothetical protein